MAEYLVDVSVTLRVQANDIDAARTKAVRYTVLDDEPDVSEASTWTFKPRLNAEPLLELFPDWEIYDEHTVICPCSELIRWDEICPSGHRTPPAMLGLI